MQTLYIIDANSLIHRAYHALPDTFSSPQGEPTNALYGLASLLLKLWGEKEPDYTAACLDRPETTFRKEEYKEYKAHRPETAEELVAQLKKAYDLFDAFDISIFEKPGYEADDCVATLAERFANEDVEVEIITGDMDILQLVDDERNIAVDSPKKGISETARYDEAGVKKRFGIRSDQIVDYKALVGDASDNIPGIEGVGKKTAADVLSEYDHIEDVFEHIEDLPTRAKNRLKGKKEEALKWRKLVTLHRDVPLPEAELDSLVADLDAEQLTKYFQDVLGSKNLVKRLRQLMGEEPRKDAERPRGKGGENDAPKETPEKENPQATLL